MKRSNRVKWGEIKVGLVITAAIAALLWASFSGGGTSIFDDKVIYQAYFSNVNGLVSGAPVWISGVEVGNVASIQFVNIDSARQILLKIRVLKKVQNMITTDAKVTIGTIGLLGDKYVEIIPGTLSKPMLVEGDVIQSTTAGDLSAVLDHSEDVVVEMKGLLGNLDTLTGRINNGEGTVGQLFRDDRLYSELTRLMASMTVLVDGLQKNQERIAGSIESVATNLDTITSRVEKNTGTIGKLLADPGLYNNLHSSTGRIDSILAKINNGEGTAGAVVNDAELYIEIKNLVVRIENLVTDIEQNPHKYFKFSVF